MLNYYKENLQFYIILTIWLFAGIYGGVAVFGVIPVMLILMRNKGMYEEIFIGYLFVLILSDSLDDRLLFAKNLKNIYIVFLSILFFFDNNEFQPINKLYKVFFPFFLFSVFTMCFSIGDPFFFTSLQKTISYFLTFLVVPNFIVKLFRDYGVEFLKRFILFCFTALVIGIILKYIAHDIAYIESGRYRGVMGNPNGLGIVAFLIFIFVFVVNTYYPQLFSRSEKIVFYLVVLLSIYMTNSRNAVLAVLIFYLFQRFYNNSPLLGFVLFLITVFLVEVIGSNISSIIQSLGLGEYFRVNTLEDGSGRYIAWTFAWNHIQENFFIGKGFGYNEFYMRQHYGELSKLGHQGGIHNSFLTFWMDQGLMGLLIYLNSFILMFFRASKNTKFAFPIMFAISFTAIFESWLVGSLSAFAFLGVSIYTIVYDDDISNSNAEVMTDLTS